MGGGPVNGAGLDGGVTGRPDRGVAGALVGTHDNAAALVDLQAGGAGQRGVGADSDGGDDEVGGHGGAVGEDRLARPQLGDGHAGAHLDAGLAQAGGNGGGHLGVERGQHVVGELDEGDGQAAAVEVLGGLHPDKAGPQDDGAAGRAAVGPGGGDGADQGIGVGDVAQGQGPLHAGDRREDGAGARRQDQGVVGQVLLGGGAGGAGGAHADGAGGAVDGGGLGAHAHVEGEAGGQRGGRLQEEVLAPGDDAADVVGQTAIGEGDVLTALDHGDGGALVEAAQAGGGAHAGGDAPDNDNAARRRLGHGAGSGGGGAHGSAPSEQARQQAAGGRGGVALAGAPLPRRHARPHLGDVPAAAGPRRLAARPAGHGSAHGSLLVVGYTPGGI